MIPEKMVVTGFVDKLGKVAHVITASDPDEAWSRFCRAQPRAVQKLEIRRMKLTEGEREKFYYVDRDYLELGRKWYPGARADA